MLNTYTFRCACIIIIVLLCSVTAAPITIEAFVALLTEHRDYYDLNRKWDPVILQQSRDVNNKLVAFSTLQNRIYEKYVRESRFTRILEVTAGDARSFVLATHVISGQSRVPRNLAGNGKNIPLGNNSALTWKVDLDIDRFPFEDNFFDFVYCNHVLQELSNPVHAYEELSRVARNGYVETPSPLLHTLLWDEYQSIGFRGHPRDRFLFWTDKDTNVLHIMPKFPLMDHILPSLYGSWELETIAVAVASSLVMSLGSDFYSWHDPVDTVYTAVNEHNDSTIDLHLTRRRKHARMIKHDIDYLFHSLAANGEFPSYIRKGIRLSIESSLAYMETFVQPMLDLKKEHFPSS